MEREDVQALIDKLKARADQLTGTEIPALNKREWELGIGAIWK